MLSLLTSKKASLPVWWLRCVGTIVSQIFCWNPKAISYIIFLFFLLITRRYDWNCCPDPNWRNIFFLHFWFNLSIYLLKLPIYWAVLTSQSTEFWWSIKFVYNKLLSLWQSLVMPMHGKWLKLTENCPMRALKTAFIR